MDQSVLQGKTLHEGLQSFNKLIPKSLQFEAAFELLSWLQDDLLTETERAVGLYVLLEVAKSPENVFIGAVAELVDLSPFIWEKLLFHNWMKGVGVGALTPAQVISEPGQAPQLQEQKNSSGVRPVVNAGSAAKDELFFGRFGPEFLRPLPEFLEVKSAETCWMVPLFVPEAVAEDRSRPQSVEKMRDWLDKAVKEPLKQEELEELMKFMNSWPTLCVKLQLPQETVRGLVTHNAEVAFEIASRLYNTNLFQGILDTLINMPLELSVLEALNGLHMKVEIPTEAIHYFVSNGIQTCRNMPKDDYERKRKARLLCVFLISILTHGFNMPAHLIEEVLSFYTEFNSQKDVEQLTKLMLDSKASN